MLVLWRFVNGNVLPAPDKILRVYDRTACPPLPLQKVNGWLETESSRCTVQHTRLLRNTGCATLSSLNAYWPLDTFGRVIVA